MSRERSGHRIRGRRVKKKKKRKRTRTEMGFYFDTDVSDERKTLFSVFF